MTHTPALDALRAVTEESYLCIPEGLRYQIEDAIAAEEERQRAIAGVVESLRWTTAHLMTLFAARAGGRGAMTEDDAHIYDTATDALAALDALARREVPR